MQLIKSFSVYTLSFFLTQAVNFLLIPVFTYYFTTQDYGILSLIATIVSLITPLILFNIDGAINIEYIKNSFNDFSGYVTSSLLISFVAFTVVFLIIFIIGDKLAVLLSVPKQWLVLIPVVCIMDSIRTVNLSIFRIQKKAFIYAFYSFSNTFFNILFALFFVIVLKYNYVGRLYGQYITSAIYFLLGIYILKKQKLINLDVKKIFIKDSFHYGLPLVPHAVGFVVINLSDRIFVSKLVGNAGLGIYSLSYNIGSIILMIALAFNNAWTPNLLELLKVGDGPSKDKAVKITYLYILCLLFLTISLTAISPLLFKYFINERFHDGLKLIPWIAFSSFFFGCYLAFTNFIFYVKKNKIFGYLSIVNIAVNLFLNYTLIAKYGIMGGGYATFISFFIFAVIIIFISIRIYPMPWLKVISKTINFGKL
jgi:O-antigen/teichoic acid export membrane protein